MSAHVVQGDARDLPLPDESVDLIVTSPPYFSLRSYKDGGEHYDGQIGDEDTPQEFVRHLIEATREMVRVLKPGGSLFVNLGDKYSEKTGPERPAADQDNSQYRKAERPRRRTGGMKPKSLMGIPWRYAIACVDDLDLILRAEVVWSKTNGLPEPVTDRVRRSHEQLFHFTKQPRYYAGVDEIREPYDGDRSWARRLKKPGTGKHDQTAAMVDEHPLGRLPGSVWTIATEPLNIPNHVVHAACCNGVPRDDCDEGVDHFAAFPTALPRRIIQGWSPAGICTACGQGRRPVTEATGERGRRPGGLSREDKRTYTGLSDAALTVRAITGYVCECNEPIATPAGGPADSDPSQDLGRGGFNRPRATDAGVTITTRWQQRHDAATLRTSPHRADMEAEAGPQAFAHYIRTDKTGARPIPATLRARWADLGWVTEPPEYEPAPTRPAVVLDVFGGTGTTAMVADVLGRTGITVDKSADYCRLAAWRTTDPDERARAAQVAKPAKQIEGQLDLFDLNDHKVTP